MDVLVVAKTRMQHGVCVGGVTANGKFVRLLDENGYHPDDSAKYGNYSAPLQFFQTLHS